MALGLFQLLVEPELTVAFLRLEWLSATLDVRNVSLYVIHPVVWAAAALAAGVVALRLAPTRRGWAAAVVFTVMANPRLLVYQLMALLAAFGGPRETRKVACARPGRASGPARAAQRKTPA